VIDPGTFISGAGALKVVFDSVRSAIGLLKDARSLGGGTEEQQQTIDKALASSSAALAEGSPAASRNFYPSKTRVWLTRPLCSVVVNTCAQPATAIKHLLHYRSSSCRWL
jgi:hypothetical protein